MGEDVRHLKTSIVSHIEWISIVVCSWRSP
jgi:hypothetical protein